MTAKGDAFALQLARLGVPVSDHVRDVCARLARCAVTVDRLAVEECNGPTWADSPAFTGAAVERWQANLDKRQAAAGKRFGRLVNDLRAAVAAADPDGVNKYVGGWSVGGDPRGYTAVVDVTRSNGDTVTVGVLS